MPVFETSRGGRIDLSLPRTQFPELNEVVEAYEQLRRERKVTSSRLSGLTRQREKAIEADRRTLADWIRKGQKGAEPGPKEVEKVEKEIAACNRRLEALEEALDDAERDLIAVVDEHREAWVEQAEVEHAAAREEFAGAVEALALSRQALSERFALVFWLRHFPDEERGAISYRVRGSYLPPLKAENGDPHTFADVVAALREDAQEHPAPRHPGSLGSEVQRVHEERRANDEAGRGYYTDEELLRLASGELWFKHGEGAQLVRPPLVIRNGDGNDEEGA